MQKNERYPGRETEKLSKHPGRDLLAAFQYLKGAYKKDRGIFTRLHSGRTRGNGFKLEEGRFR